ncbi:MAG: DoxX family membrane protein [Chlorobiota bacterium]|nr:DoxX family membrane protein [Chlorobiota bacterium]QQS67426.1 MAG: DoxX family membrane protein [Chlorobiota bacterium]
MSELNSESKLTQLSNNKLTLWLSFIARLVLGQMLLISGAEKLVALKTFSNSISNYQLIPESLNNVLALSFVWAEITVGILLILGLFVKGSSFLSTLMLSVFTIAILIAMARGLEIDCGCFAKPEPIGWMKIFKNSLWILLSFYCMKFSNSKYSAENYLKFNNDLIKS